ncbi:hypothetical protein EYR41_006484 [Orbilia oligospora]|uniref:Uncharacterized protein n=1 Tax=Orbilia oligospora TaxID=2813651 RepID=A0A7C8PSK7_ORBOL|nr:hypothetical protein TWF751_001949 [Orbilia oligospora]TGJ67351.1 hypothetical protein EYR41_006484 [Orbilia oligospora]
MRWLTYVESVSYMQQIPSQQGWNIPMCTIPHCTWKTRLNPYGKSGIRSLKKFCRFLLILAILVFEIGNFNKLFQEPVTLLLSLEDAAFPEAKLKQPAWENCAVKLNLDSN